MPAGWWTCRNSCWCALTLGNCVERTQHPHGDVQEMAHVEPPPLWAVSLFWRRGERPPCLLWRGEGGHQWPCGPCEVPGLDCPTYLGFPCLVLILMLVVQPLCTSAERNLRDRVLGDVEKNSFIALSGKRGTQQFNALVFVAQPRGIWRGAAEQRFKGGAAAEAQGAQGLFSFSLAQVISSGMGFIHLPFVYPSCVYCCLSPYV